jgi:Flp pilus assembly secretin CpaC
MTVTPAGRKIVYVASSLPMSGLSSAALGRFYPPLATTQLFNLVTGSGGFDAILNRIEVPVGMFVTLTKASDIRSVAVADEKIADVAVISPRAVLINGKAAGVTSLVFQGDKGLIQQYEVRVVAQPATTVEEIRQHLNMPDLEIAMVRNSVLLEGEVDTEDQKKKAVTIAQLYGQNVVDLLRVREARPKSEDVISKIQSELRLPAVLVRMTEGKTVLTGEVDTVEERLRAEGISRLYAKTEVVNLVQIRPYTAEELQQAIGSTTVRVRMARDAVFLEGTADSQAEASQIEEFVRKRAGGKDVMNRVRVVSTPVETAPPPVMTFSEQVQQAIDVPGVKVSGNQNLVILEGSVRTMQQLQRTLAITQGFVGDAQKIQNFLAVSAPEQVRIELAVVEVNLSRLREFGVEYPSSFLFNETTSDGGARAPGASFTRQTPFSAVLRVPPNMRSDVKILSKPNTVVLSGKQAKFQVGGEFPIPSTNTSTAGQNISAGIEFRPFGIVMTTTPTVDTLGNVYLKISTEVSDLGPTITISQGGVTSEVPIFNTRNSLTEVSLKDGQTLVLGGLIEHRDEKTVNKFPFLGRIPILGELFTSRQFQRRETELVIFVTPNVVKTDEEE